MNNNKIEKLIRPFGLRRNLDFIKARIKLAFRENLEYKINLYSAIAINIVIIFVALIFFSVYIKFTKGILDWTYVDFILYVLITLAGSKAYHIFSLKHFKVQLLKGYLNNGLIRPVNPFLFHSLYYLMGPVLIIFPVVLILVFGYIFYFNYQNVLIFILFFIFSFFYLSFLYSFFSSFAFFIKENDFTINLIGNVNGMVENYTPKMFEKISTTFVYLIPSALFGYLSIELLKGNLSLILKLLPLLIITFIFFVIGIYLLWHYGLKKYEAFG